MARTGCRRALPDSRDQLRASWPVDSRSRRHARAGAGARAAAGRLRARFCRRQRVAIRVAHRRRSAAARRSGPLPSLTDESRRLSRGRSCGARLLDPPRCGGTGIRQRGLAGTDRAGGFDPRISCVEIRCDARNVPSAAIPRRLGFGLASTVEAPAIASDTPPVQMQVWSLDLASLRTANP